jgi:hypothetical protein
MMGVQESIRRLYNSRHNQRLRTFCTIKPTLESISSTFRDMPLTPESVVMTTLSTEPSVALILSLAACSRSIRELITKRKMVIKTSQVDTRTVFHSFFRNAIANLFPYETETMRHTEKAGIRHRSIRIFIPFWLLIDK